MKRIFFANRQSPGGACFSETRLAKMRRIFAIQNLMIALQSSKATFGESRPTLALQLLFAMTIVLFATHAHSQTVSICQHWIDDWRLAGGSLPGSSRFPVVGGSSRVWWVTADTPVGSRTVHGQAWCHDTDSGAGPLEHNLDGTHCWCRMTEPYVGPWVFLATTGSALDCVQSCAALCSDCGQTGPTNFCTRGALLALP